MTPEQKTIFVAAVAADQVLAALPHNPDGAYAIADAMNLPASPSFIVWRTSVPVEEIMRNGMDWARVDNLTVGKARIWDWMSQLGTLDPSRANIRAGIDAAWVGTSADLAVRATVYTHCKRAASRVEKLFATGAGTDASPATMVFEGPIGYIEVADAMGW